MLASLGAELLKLRKRPSTWVLGLIWLAVTILLNYTLAYAVGFVLLAAFVFRRRDVRAVRKGLALPHRSQHATTGFTRIRSSARFGPFRPSLVSLPARIYESRSAD